MDVDVQENYVNLVFTTQSKITCGKPSPVDLKINKVPYCLALLDIFEGLNSTTSQKFNEDHQITHTGSSCLQLSEIIDNKGNWEASLKLPTADFPNGIKIRMLFDRSVSNIEVR